MRQQRYNGILNTCAECAAASLPPTKRFLTICDQQSVQMVVGANDWRILYCRCEREFINGRAKFTLPPKNLVNSEFRLLRRCASRTRTGINRMPASCRHKRTSNRHKKFNLMPIQMRLTPMYRKVMPTFLPSVYVSDTPSLAIAL